MIGVTDGVPVGFKEIHLRFDVETDAAPSDLDQLLATIERCCAIFQTIQTSPKTKAQTNVLRS